MLEETDEGIGSPPRTSSRTRGRGSVVTTFGTVAMITVAFDSVARNLALPQILRSLGMSVTVGGLVFSAAFVATALFNVGIGPVMDRVGRKRALQLALLAAGTFSGLTAFVTTSWQYAIIGVLAGSCLVVLTPMGVIVGEEVTPRRRGLALALVTGSFSVGTLIVGVVGSILLPGGHWRLLFLLSFAPLLLLVLSPLFIREPPRAAEAARVRKGLVTETAELRHDIDITKARQAAWRQLIAPDLRRQAIVIATGGLLMNLSTGFVLALTATYFELYYHLPVKAISLSLSIEAVAAITGNVVVGLLGHRFPARTLLVGFGFLGAVAVGLMAIKGDVAWAWVTMACFGFFGQGGLAAWARYGVESFPTRVRGSAAGFGNAFFFVGNAIAPAAFGALIGAELFSVTALTAGALSAVGALVMLFGSNHSAGRELEELTR
jgi:MFS family permease